MYALSSEMALLLLLLRAFPARGQQSTISLVLRGVGDETKRLNVHPRIRRSRVRRRAVKNYPIGFFKLCKVSACAAFTRLFSACACFLSIDSFFEKRVEY
jgi:hypothetical protein